jgi:hypothetical protein
LGLLNLPNFRFLYVRRLLPSLALGAIGGLRGTGGVGGAGGRVDGRVDGRVFVVFGTALESDVSVSSTSFQLRIEKDPPILRFLHI